MCLLARQERNEKSGSENGNGRHDEAEPRHHVENCGDEVKLFVCVVSFVEADEFLEG